VREAVPLWARHDIILWPHSLGHDATQAWKLISNTSRAVAVDRSRIRQLAATIKPALLAFYISLNTLEYLEIRGRHKPKLPTIVEAGWPPADFRVSRV